MNIVAVVSMLMITFWFWRGRTIAKLGLIWWGLHLLFIYLALWQQKPLFYAGRHIYIGGAGLVIAIASGIDQLLGGLRQARPSGGQLKWRQMVLISISLVLLTAVTHHNYTITQRIQANWLANVTEEAEIVPTLKQIMPTVNQHTQLYANRFPITPDFLRSFVYVWYGTFPTASGGRFEHLIDKGVANQNTYVFDYHNNRLFNLMPELQKHKRSEFLVSKDGRLSVTMPSNETISLSRAPDLPTVFGTDDDIRLTMPMQPPELDSWLTQTFITPVPTNSTLEFGIFQRPNLQYRLRLTDGSVQTVTLFDSQDKSIDANGWHDVSIPLHPYWGQAVILNFDVYLREAPTDTTAYWSNPRIVID